MIPTDPVLSSLTAAAACSMALDFAQKNKSRYFTWISAHTTKINLAAKLIMSGAATIGIAHVWAPATGGGGTLTLTIPPLSVIAIACYHWFGQFAIQHGFGRIISPSTPSPDVKTLPPVTVA